MLPGFSVCLELWGQLFSGETDGWEDTWVNTAVAYIHIWTDVGGVGAGIIIISTTTISSSIIFIGMIFITITSDFSEPRTLLFESTSLFYYSLFHFSHKAKEGNHGLVYIIPFLFLKFIPNKKDSAARADPFSLLLFCTFHYMSAPTFGVSFCNQIRCRFCQFVLFSYIAVFSSIRPQAAQPDRVAREPMRFALCVWLFCVPFLTLLFGALCGWRRGGKEQTGVVCS